jgi:hypothetical protein
MSLVLLPNELLSYIVQHLDANDLFNLALSCRHFQELIRDENIYRRVLKVTAKISREETQFRYSIRNHSY